jgi:hypothetical protein
MGIFFSMSFGGNIPTIRAIIFLNSSRTRPTHGEKRQGWTQKENTDA